jgi:hypothetical protein
LALARQAKTIPKGDLHPMAKIIPITEHYQHFLAEMKESFWGDVYGRTKLVWKQWLDRVIYPIFQRFNLEWKTRTLSVFTQAA